MKKKSVALVLSGGGSKGLAHIGVINELEKQGFKISSISGTSIGSVIGGIYAMGKLPEYTQWLNKLNPKSIWGLMDFTFSIDGLLKGEKVFNEMKTFIPDMAIEDMNIPFAAVATDILNEKEVVFKTGSFYKAIRASVAIPTIFTPVEYEDTILVDGGVLNPIPIEHVERKKEDLLVVVSLYGEKNGAKKKEIDLESKVEDKDSVVSIINGYISNISSLISSGDRRSFGYYSLLNATSSAMIHKLAKHNIEKHQPDLVISIPGDSASTFDFHKSEELIKLGSERAKLEISRHLSANSSNATAIICVYNEEKTIREVVTAVSNFSFNEIIIVNDGSTDKTSEILAELESIYDIKNIKLPQNMGKGYAMATGIENASCEIVVFLDADMLNFKGDHFTQLIQPLQKREMEMVLGQPSETLIKTSINPFKSFTGQRALYKDDILPIVDKMKEANFGVETLINLYYQSKGKRIKYVMLLGLKHPTKYDKTSSTQATKEFIKEGQEIAITALKNFDLITKIINNTVSKNK